MGQRLRYPIFIRFKVGHLDHLVLISLLFLLVYVFGVLVNNRSAKLTVLGPDHPADLVGECVLLLQEFNLGGGTLLMIFPLLAFGLKKKLVVLADGVEMF